MAAGALPALAASIRAGDRRALARAITTVESTLPEHRVQADALLSELRPTTGEIGERVLS
jgi:LAO/AO transport system kinase